MSVASRESTRNARLVATRATVVREAREARKALNRIVRLVEPASRESRWLDDDGLEQFDVVRLSDAEHLENLRVALAWLQQAENRTREVRVAMERALDNNGWRMV